MEMSNNSSGETVAQALAKFLGLAEALTDAPSLYATPDQINGMFANNRLTNESSLNGAPVIDSSGASDSSDGLSYTYNIQTNSLWKDLSYQLGQIVNLISRKKLHEITEEDADDIARDAEELGYDWIYQNYGKHEVIEDGDFIITRVMDKMADFVDERLHDEYDFDDWPEMYEAAVEVIMSRVNLDYVLSIVEDIMQAPTAMAEKLRDIGMSQSDFV